MESQFCTVEEALEELRAGRLILTIDDPDRENEGDLICAAQLATTENVNFMATHAKGLICTPMSAEIADRLGLEQMVKVNTDNHATAFTVSIDHVDTTTGISAPINTIRILGNSPVPNHMVINGTQARGGTERKAVKRGPSSALAFLFQPIRMPKEIPSSQAKARAINTRRRLAQMWPKRLSCLIGFSISSRNRFQISTGEGKVLFSAPAAKNHSRIRSRTETTGNTA